MSPSLIIDCRQFTAYILIMSLITQQSVGAGKIFRLGEQKLNDFSVGEAKNGEKQSRQLSNSKYNFVQYVFFEKDMRNGVCGKAPRS